MSFARKALNTPAGPALLAAILGGAAVLAGLHGTDWAAQVYRAGQVRAHGLTPWDNGWYSGNYPIGYSVLFPLLGAVLGLAVVAVASAAAAAALFDCLVTAWWGRRPPASWYFAVCTVLSVSIGQLPYLSGEAFGLGAVLALRRRRRFLALGLALACGLCSGVDAVFLGIALLGWILARRRVDADAIWAGVVAGIPAVVLGALTLTFPGTGMFPYPVGGLLWVLMLCLLAVGPAFRGVPAVRAGSGAYAAVAVASFLIPSPMGGNASRFAQTVGIPLAACFLLSPPRSSRGKAPFQPRRRPLWPSWSLSPPAPRMAAAALILPLALWQWAPGLEVIAPPASGPATTAAYYRPLVARINALSKGPVRVEIPPTRQHWESAYVAPEIPLARGWERQLDIADNPLFYTRGALTPETYERWLDTNGVSFVALPSAPLDYAAAAEGRLLRSGAVSTLRLVWQSPRWKLWKVAGSPGLVSGPATVTRLGAQSVTLLVRRPSTLAVRVRYSPYWVVAGGSGCIGRGGGGWLSVRARSAGPMRLQISLTGRRSGC